METEEEEKNHPGQWLFELGMAYLYGSDFKKKDFDRGQTMVEASASFDFPMAIAECHYWGWYGLEEDDKKAFENYLKIEKDTNGYHWAQFMIGFCYEDGIGTDRDENKAFEFHTKSARQGNSDAMNHLGACYRHGNGCDQSDTKAFEWYTKSAEQGHIQAMIGLAECYENGYGCDRDQKKSFELFQAGAKLGASWSMYVVGLYYEHGTGVAKNLNKAREWYVKVSDHCLFFLFLLLLLLLLLLLCVDKRFLRLSVL